MIAEPDLLTAQMHRHSCLTAGRRFVQGIGYPRFDCHRPKTFKSHSSNQPGIGWNRSNSSFLPSKAYEAWLQHARTAQYVHSSHVDLVECVFSVTKCAEIWPVFCITKNAGVQCISLLLAKHVHSHVTTAQGSTRHAAANVHIADKYGGLIGKYKQQFVL